MKKKLVLNESLDVKDYVEQVLDYNLDLINNTIYLLGEESYISETSEGAEPGVEFSMVNRFLKNMSICLMYNPRKHLTIHMKTCGGDWQEGMALYNAIKAYPNPVTIVSYTHARSMSSLVLQAGSTRYLLEDSVFMFHWGSYADFGELKTVKSTLDFHTKVSEPRMIEIYTRAMQKSKKFKGFSDEKCKVILEDQMNKKGDVYLTSQEAIEWGFADKILKDWRDLKHGGIKRGK